MRIKLSFVFFAFSVLFLFLGCNRIINTHKFYDSKEVRFDGKCYCTTRKKTIIHNHDFISFFSLANNNLLPYDTIFLEDDFPLSLNYLQIRQSPSYHLKLPKGYRITKNQLKHHIDKRNEFANRFIPETEEKQVSLYRVKNEEVFSVLHSPNSQLSRVYGIEPIKIPVWVEVQENDYTIETIDEEIVCSENLSNNLLKNLCFSLQQLQYLENCTQTDFLPNIKKAVFQYQADLGLDTNFIFIETLDLLGVKH